MLAASFVPSTAFAGLGTPSGLTATAAIAAATINLAWSGSPGNASAVGVERSTDGTTFSEIAEPAPSSTTYQDTGLVSGQTYWYRVRYLGGGKNVSPYTNVASATTPDIVPPSVPTGLTATVASCSQVNLAWSASTDTGGSGLKGYKVYRNGTYLKQVLAPATTTSDTSLQGSTNYSYTVSAIDNAGNESAQSGAKVATTSPCPTTTTTSTSSTSSTSSSSSTSSTTSTSRPTSTTAKSTTSTLNTTTSTLNTTTSTLNTTTTTIPAVDTTPPSVPTGITATAAGCSQVNVAWNASTDTGGSGLKGYNIWTWNNAAVFVKQVLAPATSTAITGVVPSSTNYYTVTAVDNAGNQSNIVTWAYATTPACASDTTPPSVPAGVSATAASCSQINLSWQASTDNAGGSGVLGYNVYRGGAFLKQVLAPAVSTSDTGLAASTVYSYQVAAVDNAGNVSSLSTTVNANTPACPDTTPPSVPTGVSATATGCQLSVSWNASTDTGGSGLMGYNVYRNGSFWTQVLAPATSTSDTGAAATMYSYSATAVDNAGNVSAMSATANATTAPSCTARQLIGFVPGVGTPYDVVVNTTTHVAYIASAEFGLSVVDVSNHMAPVVLGGANPPFEGSRVGVSGSLAAVDAGVMGLRLVDVSTPSAPKTIGQLSAAALGGSSVAGVALNGTVAYVLVSVAGNPGHTDFVTVNVATPAAPVVLGRVSLVSGQEIRLVGSLAYVAAGSSGLIIVNVATPSAPSIVGSVDTPGTAAGVAVAGSYAYVADTSSVQVVNVATPSRPVIAGSLAASALAVQVSGNRLYTTDGGSFRVVDVTTPTAPVLLNTSNSYGAQGLALDGTAAVLVSPNITGSQGGLYLWDVSTTTPTMNSTVDDAFGNMEVAVSGSLAVATGGQHGMKVLNVSTPSAPTVVSTLSATTLGGTVVGATIAGQTAYALVSVAGNPGHADVVVVSLSVPSAPTIAGRLSLIAGTTIKVAGSLVYVAAGSAGLQIVSVASPSAPTFVGSVDTPGTADDVVVGSGYAYVADSSSLQVVNVSTPSHPTIAGTLATTATAVALNGTRLYAVDGGQFKVIDVTTPTAPALLSSTGGYGSVQGVTVVGTTAYLATPAQLHSDTTGGVYVLDVSTPAQPKLLQQLVVPGMTRMLTTDQAYIYASDYNSVLDILTR
jgi:hypothetical protein